MLINNRLAEGARRALSLLLISWVVSYLLFLDVWDAYKLLHASRWQYYLRTPPGNNILFVVLACSAGTTIFIWLVTLLWPRRWIRFGTACSAVLLLVIAGRSLFFHLPINSGEVFFNAVLFFLLAPITFVVGMRNSEIVRRGIHTTTAIACGIFLFDIVGFLISREWQTDHAAYKAQPPAAHKKAKQSGNLERVVWAVFDEFDYSIAFNQRDSRVSLPNLDALRKEALFATNALPPGLWTMDAIPSYLLGKPFTEVVPSTSNELLLTPSPSGPPSMFKAEESLPGRFSSIGAGVAVVGWYHPYSRLLRTIPCDCLWEPCRDSTPAILFSDFLEQEGLITGIRTSFALEMSLLGSWGKGNLDKWRTAEHAIAKQAQSASLEKLLKAGVQAATNSDYDFVFLHLPIPHPPAIINRQMNIDSPPSTGVAYYDNLNLMDRYFGMLRKSMEEAGLWDSTQVIITSDHGLRESVWKHRPSWSGLSDFRWSGDRRKIPLFIKLRGNSKGAEYDKPFSSILLHDLVLELTHGKITSQESLLSWIDSNRTRHPLSWPVRTFTGQTF